MPSLTNVDFDGGVVDWRLDEGDAVEEEEGADDADAGDDVTHLASSQPVPLHPLM